MGRIITITSGKGGVGKTTITANLGTALAIMGHRVCLIDADFGLRNLDIPLGLTNRVIYDIGDYLKGLCYLKQVIVKDKRMPNLTFLPGSKDESAQDIPPTLFRKFIEDISEFNDFVLIDSPAGIDDGFRNAAYAANEAIVITTPSRASIQDADRVVGLLEEYIPSPPQLIINRERDGKISDIVNTLQVDLLGIIRHDFEVIRSIHQGLPIVLNTNNENGLRFRHLARNLINYEVKPFISINQKEKRRIFPPLFKQNKFESKRKYY